MHVANMIFSAYNDIQYARRTSSKGAISDSNQGGQLPHQKSVNYIYIFLDL